MPIISVKDNKYNEPKRNAETNKKQANNDKITTTTNNKTE